MGPGYRHVACCIDDSPQSEPVIAEAVRLLADGPDAVISLVHAVSVPAAVLTVPVPDMGTMLAGARSWLDATGERVAGDLRASGSPARVEVVLLEGHAGVAACAWAEETDVDLIVAAAHRGYLDRALLGSFAGYVAYHAPCAVHLVRPAKDD
jgi:nucleotide-binding universal stress UspA family protein